MIFKAAHTHSSSPPFLFPSFPMLAATKTPFTVMGRIKMTLEIGIPLRRLLRTITPPRWPLSTPHHANHMWKPNPCLSLVSPHNAKVFPLEAIRFTQLTTTPEDPDRWMLCRFRSALGLFTDCHEIATKMIRCKRTDFP